MANRKEKVESVLHVTAAEFLAREASRQSLITVTRTEVSDDGKRATIFLSILPDSAARAALGFANRNIHEFIRFFKTHTRGIMPPHIEFVLDKGEKHRQRIDEISLGL